jgi:hypothetical protein
LIKLQSDRFWILIAGARIVDRDRKQSIDAIFGADCSAKVGGESSDSTLTGKIVSNEGNPGRQCKLAMNFRYRRMSLFWNQQDACMFFVKQYRW